MFPLAAKGKVGQDEVNEFHRAVTKYTVKALHPFSTVDSDIKTVRILHSSPNKLPKKIRLGI